MREIDAGDAAIDGRPAGGVLDGCLIAAYRPIAYADLGHAMARATRVPCKLVPPPSYRDDAPNRIKKPYRLGA